MPWICHGFLNGVKSRIHVLRYITLGDYYIFIFLQSDKTRFCVFYLTGIILFYYIFIIKYNIIYAKDFCRYLSIDYRVRRSMRWFLNNKKQNFLFT